MPVLPIPNRCIWCLRAAPDVTFNVSHVLPSCVGNVNQCVLPPGIVCTPCNSHFGSKVEPWLLKDPQFHIIAVALGVIDPDDMQRFRKQIFDAEHPSDYTPINAINLKVDIQKQTTIQTDIEYTVKGRITKTYSLEDQRKISRAVHKIAFESVAWTLYVQGHDTPVDLFSDQFNMVREWVREGQPLRTVRPVLRLFPTSITPKWSSAVWNYPNKGMAVELSIFGDWYIVSLTSTHGNVLSDLKSWEWHPSHAGDAWVFADSFERYEPK
jgi:hypothetical protein